MLNKCWLDVLSNECWINVDWMHFQTHVQQMLIQCTFDRLIWSECWLKQAHLSVFTLGSFSDMNGISPTVLPVFTFVPQVELTHTRIIFAKAICGDEWEQFSEGVFFFWYFSFLWENRRECNFCKVISLKRNMTTENEFDR